MSYRNDDDAALARLVTVEGELAAMRAERDTLEYDLEEARAHAWQLEAELDRLRVDAPRGRATIGDYRVLLAIAIALLTLLFVGFCATDNSCGQ